MKYIAEFTLYLLLVGHPLLATAVVCIALLPPIEFHNHTHISSGKKEKKGKKKKK